jgi:hypothetical protein
MRCLLLKYKYPVYSNSSYFPLKMLSYQEQNYLFGMSIYIGLVVFAIGYGTFDLVLPLKLTNLNVNLPGAYLGIYCLSTHFLLINTKMTRSQRIFYIAYGSILILFNTVNFMDQVYLCRKIWITDREEAAAIGDQSFYNIEEILSSLQVIGNEAQNIAVVLSDILLVTCCLFFTFHRLMPL